MTVEEARRALISTRHLVDAQRWQEATTTVRPALADPATAGEGFCLLAQAELSLGRPMECVAAARSALAAGHSGEWPHRLVAMGYRNAGRLKDAAAAAEEAVRIAPTNDHALYAFSLIRLQRRERDDAERLARRNVAENPHSSLAMEMLGHVMSVRRRARGEAEAAYREALRLDPHNSEAALGLGRVLHAQGRHAEAGQAFLTAAHAEPTDDRPRRGLVRLGVPLVALGWGAKLVLLQAGRGVFTEIHQLRTGLVVWLAFILVGAGVTTWLRVRGGRHLPEHIRRGLVVDYRNAALRWCLWGGVGVGVIAVAALSGAGGNLPLGVVSVVIAAAMILASRRWTVQPIETVPPQPWWVRLQAPLRRLVRR